MLGSDETFGTVPALIKKKICLLGAFGVGKTSLISKFVLNVFTEKYLSSVGVKVDKKTISLGPGRDITMMVWDLEGRDDYVSVSDSYLRGMSGYFLVADGTRPGTVEDVRAIRDSLRGLFDDIPSMLLLNKADLGGSWRLDEADFGDFRADGIEILRTSAKDGTGVEESFADIARKMLDGERT